MLNLITDDGDAILVGAMLLVIVALVLVAFVAPALTDVLDRRRRPPSRFSRCEGCGEVKDTVEDDPPWCLECRMRVW